MHLVVDADVDGTCQDLPDVCVHMHACGRLLPTAAMSGVKKAVLLHDTVDHQSPLLLHHTAARHTSRLVCSQSSSVLPESYTSSTA